MKNLETGSYKDKVIDSKSKADVSLFTYVNQWTVFAAVMVCGSAYLLTDSLVLSVVVMFVVFISFGGYQSYLNDRYKQSLKKVANVIKAENEAKANAIQKGVTKELKRTSKEPVIISSQLKTKIVRKLEAAGLLETVSEGEAFKVIYDELTDEKHHEANTINQAVVVDTNTSKPEELGSSDKKDSERTGDKTDNNNDDYCESNKRDSMGNCIKEHSGYGIDAEKAEEEWRRRQQEEEERKPTYIMEQPREINPATGLPIMKNGLDRNGNPIGRDLDRERMDEEDRRNQEQRAIDERQAREENDRQNLLRLLQLEEDERRIANQRLEDERRWGGQDARSW